MQHFDRANSPSSLGAQISVPKDFHIHTPPELVAPLHEVSLPVQLSSALASIGVMDRASMFLQGRHNELLKSMNKTEARLVVKKVQFLDTVRPNTYFASTMSIWLYCSEELGTWTANLECDQLEILGLAVILY
jgi:hypothetical protein